MLIFQLLFLVKLLSVWESEAVDIGADSQIQTFPGFMQPFTHQRFKIRVFVNIVKWMEHLMNQLRFVFPSSYLGLLQQRFANGILCAMCVFNNPPIVLTAYVLTVVVYFRFFWTKGIQVSTWRQSYDKEFCHVIHFELGFIIISLHICIKHWLDM